MNNVGFYQFNKNKRLKKLHLSIDSRERDTKIYPDPNNYKIVLNNNGNILNINSIRVIEVFIPHSEYTINNTNNKIEVMYDDGNIHVYTIEPQFIDSGHSLQHALRHASNDVGGNLNVILEINFNEDLNKIELNSLTASEYTILFESGNCSKQTPREVIGFLNNDIVINKIDKIGDNVINLHHTKYIDLVIPEIPNISNKLMIKNDLNTYVLKRIPMIAGFGEVNHYFAPEDSVYNYFNPMNITSFTMQLFNDKGDIYNSNGENNYITFEITMLADDSPDNIEFIPPFLGDSDPSLKKGDPKDLQNTKNVDINNLEFIDKSTSIKKTSDPIILQNDNILLNEIKKINGNLKNSMIIPNHVKQEIKENFNNDDFISLLKELLSNNVFNITSVAIFLIIFLFIYSRKK